MSDSVFPNRQVQLKILKKLTETYPAKIDVQQWKNEFPSFTQELFYLNEHGLVDAQFNTGLGTKGPTPFTAKISKSGIDFLADDGGLSSILGVVTVKLHADTIKDLLAKEINHSNIPLQDKKRYLDRLRELPAESTKHLVNTLVAEGAKAGLSHAPSAAHWLQTLFQSL